MSKTRIFYILGTLMLSFFAISTVYGAVTIDQPGKAPAAVQPVPSQPNVSTESFSQANSPERLSGLDDAPVYLRSITGQPWGEVTNEAAMDAAFGSGLWDDLRYETVNTATLFSNARPLIFMEGGDSTANEMEAFLTANMSDIEDWVAGSALCRLRFRT